ncbi:MAG: flagellar biosynthesis anti-sigma factor FlgM [Rhodospirillaceae bacterium]
MKIDHVAKSVAGATNGDKAPRAAKQEAPASQGDRVELSPLSAQLQAFRSDAAGEVDMARVQEIKQAISEGRFKVNAEVVADKLLETVKDLLQNRTLQ